MNSQKRSSHPSKAESSAICLICTRKGTRQIYRSIIIISRLCIRSLQGSLWGKSTLSFIRGTIAHWTITSSIDTRAVEMITVMSSKKSAWGILLWLAKIKQCRKKNQAERKKAPISWNKSSQQSEEAWSLWARARKTPSNQCEENYEASSFLLTSLQLDIR